LTDERTNVSVGAAARVAAPCLQEPCPPRTPYQGLFVRHFRILRIFYRSICRIWALLPRCAATGSCSLTTRPVRPLSLSHGPPRFSHHAPCTRTSVAPSRLLARLLAPAGGLEQGLPTHRGHGLQRRTTLAHSAHCTIARALTRHDTTRPRPTTRHDQRHARWLS
jgi:hypothetical protein